LAPFCGLLLKAVQHVNEVSELHRVCGAIRVGPCVGNNLHHGGSVEALERLGVDVLAA